MSCHMALPGNAPLCSFRKQGRVGVLGYRRALKALRQIVEQAGDNPKEFGLHSLRIGGATTMAARGEISDRVDGGKVDGNRTQVPSRNTLGVTYKTRGRYRVN